jgi:hypothetical protein
VFRSDSPLRQLLPGIRENERHGLNYQTWTLLTLGLWLEAHEASLS